MQGAGFMGLAPFLCLLLGSVGYEVRDGLLTDPLASAHQV